LSTRGKNSAIKDAGNKNNTGEKQRLKEEDLGVEDVGD